MEHTIKYNVKFQDDLIDALVTDMEGNPVKLEEILSAISDFSCLRRLGCRPLPILSIEMGEKIRFDPASLSFAGRSFLHAIDLFDIYAIVDYEKIDFITGRAFKEAVISAQQYHNAATNRRNWYE